MKFLRVDMTHQQIKVEDIGPEYSGLGGRGYEYCKQKK